MATGPPGLRTQARKCHRRDDARSNHDPQAPHSLASAPPASTPPRSEPAGRFDLSH
jgi:hypothetical protein